MALPTPSCRMRSRTCRRVLLCLVTRGVAILDDYSPSARNWSMPLIRRSSCGIDCSDVAGIVLDRVSKVFGAGVVAVDDVSLEIESGEFLVLVGPSGCGKSTLLRMIAGLEDATGGTILIDGRDVTDLPPRARDVAMVFQTYALYPHMTVRENLGYGLKVRKTPYMEEETGATE